MAHAYYNKIDQSSLVVIDLVEADGLQSVPPKTLIITRINVPAIHRHKGHASRLLAQVLDDADASSTTLALEIQESGGLTFPQLESWYKRRGFKWGPHRLMWRKPKSNTSHNSV